MTNGSGARRCQSWIEAFTAYTANVETPAPFRKWAAIATLAAVLEQKVWIQTSSKLHPNLYTFLIAPPGIGKTRIINEAARMIMSLPEPYMAPVSLNHASIVDQMTDSRRVIINTPDPPLEYHSLALFADELGTFMSEYETALVGLLSSFYDPQPYGQRRRGGDLKIKIESPQLNMLVGSTPSNLMKFMPEGAWEQGFTSRIIFVHSDEKKRVDDFAEHIRPSPADLHHDLRIINNLIGKFEVTADYRQAVNNWLDLDAPPKPTHPRLVHYATRRKAHLYRLSMIAAIDRSDHLILDKAAFNCAMGWLLEAEETMPGIFAKTTAGNSDAGAMDEIMHFVQSADTGTGIAEHRLIKFTRNLVPTHSVLRVIEIMEKSGLIHVSGVSRMSVRTFKAGPGGP